MAILDLQRPHSHHFDNMSGLDLSYAAETCSPEQDLDFDTTTFDIDDLLRDSPTSENTDASPEANFPVEGEDFFNIPSKLWSSYTRERSQIEAAPDSSTRGRGTSSDSGTETRMAEAESIQYTAAEPRKARRQAQNRAAQRAFRERKEKYIQELEGKVVVMGRKINSLESDRKRLEGLVRVARTEVETLRSLPSQFTRQPSQSDRSQIACKIDGIPGRHSLLLTFDLGIQAVKICSGKENASPSVALSKNDDIDIDKSPG